MADKKTGGRAVKPAAQKDDSPRTVEKAVQTVTKPRPPRKAKEEPVQESGPKSEKFIHQFMPYIFLVFTLFLIACFIFARREGAVGDVGKALRDLFCGLFGFTAFLSPLVFINLALYWRKYVDMHMMAWKITLSVITLTLVAALFHVASLQSGYSWAVFGKSIFGTGGSVSNWANGKASPPVGGGFIGGLVGGLFYCATGPVGSFIILIAAIFVGIMFLFSVTPAYVWNSMRLFIGKCREKRAERKAAVAQEEAAISRRAAEQRAAAERARAAKAAQHPAVITDDVQDIQKTRVISGVLENNSSPAPAKTAETRRKRSRDAELTAAVIGRTAQKPEGIPEIVPPGTEYNEPAPGATPAADNAAPADTYARTAHAQPAAPERKPAEIQIKPAEPEKKAAQAPVAADEPDEASKPTVKILDDVLNGRERKSVSGTVSGSAADLAAAIAAGRRTAQAPSAAEEAPAEKGTDILGAMTQISEPQVEEPEPDEPVSVTDAAKPTADRLSAYFFPPIDLLHKVKAPSDDDIENELRTNAQKLMDKLAAFNVGIKKIEYSRGPTITRYELYPEANTRVRAIASLADDIALELAATIRLEAPIPNKNAVGVEVPNQVRALVPIRDLIDSEKFKSMPSKLSACLGKDVGGNMVFFDIGKMPHLLIAGTTGSGKSVCLNCIILSLLYKARPDEVQFIMIDPKKIEMGMYNNLPHMKVPVVTDMKRAAGTLNAAVNEMEHRYSLFEDCNSRDLDGYNRLMAASDPGFIPLPRLVIIIDELADLMMTCPQEIENSIIRLAQKARAAGIHLIIGTQRPSVNVITGLIKANVPSRIAFSVVSNVESRIIIDIAGAEKLIGKGDMLFAPIGAQKPARLQGAFVDDDEVRAVTDFIKKNSLPVEYDDEFLSSIEAETERLIAQDSHGKNDEDDQGTEFVQEADPLFNKALHVGVDNGSVATSLLQRKLSVGFGRAAKIIDRMEALGFVSPANGTKPRNILITRQQLDELELNNDPRAQGRFT